VNDEFKPILLDAVSDYELRIFDRWGKLIFVSTNPDVGWNGNENNKPKGIEEYIWTVHYRNDAGQEKLAKGGVTLLK
jgi:gliding motility-associated-like protein